MSESPRQREASSVPAKPAATKLVAGSWKLAKVKVLSGTISRKAIQATFDHDRAIGRCAIPAEAKPGQRLILTLTVNTRGKVAKVKPADGSSNAEPWVKCLVEAIKVWWWQNALDGKKAQIRLELEVRA